MYKKIFLAKINMFCLFCVICFIFVSIACADSPLRITHKINYGERLIGSVDLQFETITWVGSWTPDYVHLAGFDPAFGFTGDALYNDFTVNYPDNRWRMGSLIDAGIKRPVPNDQSLGFWFAPDREGKITTTSYTYQWNSQSNPNNLDRVEYFYTGIGLVDDVLNPDIVLDVTTLSDSNGDNKIDLGMHDEASFEVMASSLNPDVEHIMVILDVWEQNGCIGENVSFEENVDTENSFEYNDYLHYIVGYDPDKTYTRSCIRQHVFIVSAGKAFRVKVKNIRATAKNAFATYNFYVRGHYDAADETLWADSHAVFELTADYGSSSDMDSDGDGIADSIDPCPYDPQNNCNTPVDSDGDGIADSIDPCPYDPQNNCNTPVDSDGDGIADSIDPCPYDPQNNCNAPVNSDGVRVRLMWPDDSDMLCLRNLYTLDLSAIGGCDFLDWGDSCVDYTVRETNLSVDGTGEVNLASAGYGNKSVRYLSDDVIEFISAQNDEYTVKEKLADSDKDYFSFNIDWSVVDTLMNEKGSKPGDYKYWIRATYQGKFYYLEKVSKNWFPVEVSAFNSFFYENNFNAISENLFAIFSTNSSYSTFQVPDIFIKEDLEKIKIEYGVIPWDSSYTPSQPMLIDNYSEFKKNYSFVLYNQDLDLPGTMDWTMIPFGAYKELPASSFSQTDLPPSLPLGFFSESGNLLYSPNSIESVDCDIDDILVITASGSGDSVILSVDSDESTIIFSDQENNAAYVYFMPGMEPSFIVKDVDDNPEYDGLYLKTPEYSSNPMFSFSSIDPVSAAIIGEPSDSIALPKRNPCLIQINTSNIPTQGRLYYGEDLSDWRVGIESKYWDSFSYTESSTGNAYGKIEIRSPISYDSKTGILNFDYPEPDVSGKLDETVLNSICFKITSSRGENALGEVFSLKDVDSIRKSVESVDEYSLSLFFNNHRDSILEINLNNLLPPGEYFVQVLKSSISDDGNVACSDEAFDDVQWGLLINIPVL